MPNWAPAAVLASSKLLPGKECRGPGWPLGLAAAASRHRRYLGAAQSWEDPPRRRPQLAAGYARSRGQRRHLEKSSRLPGSAVRACSRKYWSSGVRQRTGDDAVPDRPQDVVLHQKPRSITVAPPLLGEELASFGPSSARVGATGGGTALTGPLEWSARVSDRQAEGIPRDHLSFSRSYPQEGLKSAGAPVQRRQRVGAVEDGVNP